MIQIKFVPIEVGKFEINDARRGNTAEIKVNIDPLTRFTTIVHRHDKFWVYWETTGNLPTGKGIGTIPHCLGVILEEIFAPLPEYLYRLTKNDDKIVLEKLTQKLC
jgi:hypothetical protein